MEDTRNQYATPLYRRVGDDIISKIKGAIWQPGDKLPSERALCEQYQVSQITVRRALRELAHEGRVYSRHGLGWFVTTPVAERAPERDVAVVLPRLDWCMARVAQELADRLRDRDIAMRLVFTDGDLDIEAHAVSSALKHGVGGLLLVVTGREREMSSRYARLLAAVDVPVMFFLRPVPSTSAPALILDEAHCMEQVTTHILDLGHRRIAYAGSNPASIEGQQRYRGFASTLWNRGLELPLDWVFSAPLRADSGERRFKRVFSQPDHPTALVCASDLLAAEALSLLRLLGVQCPAQVAVVGMGDRDFAEALCPSLTTYRVDCASLGAAAADMLSELLDGHTVGNRIVAGELVLRESCGARFSRF